MARDRESSLGWFCGAQSSVPDASIGLPLSHAFLIKEKISGAKLAPQSPAPAALDNPGVLAD